MEQKRERLSSRLGFILLSAGCAIGCGNVWKFPWMCGQYGGGGFVLIYIICLLVLGLPIMTMEFSIGRAARKSPVLMYQQIEKPGTKWHWHGYVSLFGNFALMAFYTAVTGWMLTYFFKFATGNTGALNFVQDVNNPFVNMITNTKESIIFTAITVVIAFAILCFKLSSGLERITKYMMVALLLLMVALSINNSLLDGAAEGLKFYLVPDFSKINGNVVVGAMNQAFFTLSLGMGSMAIFGSYINKERSLMGESINVIILDTIVALTAGLIIFPACSSMGVDVGAGPGLLFNTMSTVFNNMKGGRLWGSLFFLFMVFAALSTVLAVCENIVAMIRDLTGWNRPVACLVCGAAVMGLALTTILGFNAWSGFVPFADGTGVMDLWDFLVSNNILPLGSLVYVLFCCSKKGWGWDNFVAEANTGKGVKVQAWMKPICKYIVPIIIIFIYIYGIITFGFKGNFVILDWIKGLF